MRQPIMLLLALLLAPMAAQGAPADVEEGRYVRASLDRADLKGEVGSMLVTGLRIENLHTETLRVQVTVEGVPGHWTAPQPSPLDLKPATPETPHATIPLTLLYNPGETGRYDEERRLGVRVSVTSPEDEAIVLETLELPLTAHYGGMYVPLPPPLLALTIAALVITRRRHPT